MGWEREGRARARQAWNAAPRTVPGVTGDCTAKVVPLKAPV